MRTSWGGEGHEDAYGKIWDEPVGMESGKIYQEEQPKTVGKGSWDEGRWRGFPQPQHHRCESRETRNRRNSTEPRTGEKQEHVFLGGAGKGWGGRKKKDQEEESKQERAFSLAHRAVATASLRRT